MESRLLEYLLRVAEMGSINKAAADLQLSQPALSRQISSLEEEMGAPLFVRTRGGVQLTEAGAYLTARARPLLRQFSMLKEQVGESAAGQLAIGVPPSWHRIFTTPYAKTLCTQFPLIKLRIHEGVSHLLRDYMTGGILDLCVMPFDTTPPAGFRQTALVREPLIVLGQASERLKPDEPTPLSRLDGASLILPARPNAVRMQLEHMLTRKGLQMRVGLETDTLGLCLDLAQQGLGITVVPACTLYGTSLSEGLGWSPLRGLYLTWALFESNARSHSHAVREGRRVVQSTLLEAIEARVWFGVEPMGSLAHPKKTAA